MKDIVKIAFSFIGQKEIPGNQGFVDPKFEDLMKLTGWKKSQAWCAYFAELVWTATGVSGVRNFSGSAVQTWNNFKNACWPGMGDRPEVGDVVIQRLASL